MKNVVIILGIGCVLLLCCAVFAGGGYYLYTMYSSSPQTAWSDAFDALEDGDYYKVDTDMSVSMDMEFPGYPTQTMSMSMSGTGEYDIQNTKSYADYSTTIDGSSTDTERYQIGDDVYVSVDGGTFTKVAAGDDDQISAEETLKEISTRDDYTVLEDETIEGEDSYHYEVTLTEDDLMEFAEGLSDSISEGGTMSVSDVSASNGTLEVWIAKDTKRLMKVIMNIEVISIDAITEGYNVTVSMNDLEMSTVYNDWGVENDIKAPI